jgi:hypothetical protein
VNVKSPFELHAKPLAKAAKCISHCFSLIVATRLFPPKRINQQSSYRAINSVRDCDSSVAVIIHRRSLAKKLPRLGMGSLAYRFSEKGELG